MPIEQLRSMLLIGLMMVGFLIWQAWQEDYAPAPPPQSATTSRAAPAEGSTVDVPNAPAVDTSRAVESRNNSADIPLLPGQAVTAQVSSETSEIVRVETDLLDVVIDTVGGTLREVRLRAFDASVEPRDGAFTLITPELPNVFLVQSGLVGTSDAPTHRSQFSTTIKDFQLADGEAQLIVPMSIRTTSGLEIT